MRRSTIWFLRFSYFVSQLLGALSFKYDCRTGEIYTSLQLTTYSAVINLSKLAFIPLLLRLDFGPETLNVPDLHIRITSITFLLRPLTIFVTLISNWTRRQGFLQTLRDLERLRRNYYTIWPLRPRVEEKFEQELRAKCLWGILTGLFMIMGSREYFQKIYKVDNI